MTQVEERTGEAFEFAEQLTVVGRKLRPGDLAPNFTLERFDAAEGAMRQGSTRSIRRSARSRRDAGMSYGSACRME